MHTSQAAVVITVVMQKEKGKCKKWEEEPEFWSVSGISGLWGAGQKRRSAQDVSCCQEAEAELFV